MTKLSIVLWILIVANLLMTLRLARTNRQMRRLVAAFQQEPIALHVWCSICGFHKQVIALGTGTRDELLAELQREHDSDACELPLTTRWLEAS